MTTPFGGATTEDEAIAYTIANPIIVARLIAATMIRKEIEDGNIFSDDLALPDETKQAILDELERIAASCEDNEA